jgi:hypothetical protein
MAQTVTVVSLAMLAAGLLFFYFRRSRADTSRPLRVSIRLDRMAPGAHLMWDIVNTSTEPVILTKLIVQPRHVRHTSAESVPFAPPRRIAPEDEAVIATDVDWGMLAARSIALVDELGYEYPAPHRQLEAAQDQLHRLIDRRVYTASARDFLFGAGDLAFGAVILGMGFFMLMWVIATG